MARKQKIDEEMQEAANDLHERIKAAQTMTKAEEIMQRKLDMMDYGHVGPSIMTYCAMEHVFPLILKDLQAAKIPYEIPQYCRYTVRGIDHRKVDKILVKYDMRV